MRHLQGQSRRNIEKCGLHDFSPQSDRPLRDFRLSQRPTFRCGKTGTDPGTAYRTDKPKLFAVWNDSFERGWLRGRRLLTLTLKPPVATDRSRNVHSDAVGGFEAVQR